MKHIEIFKKSLISVGYAVGAFLGTTFVILQILNYVGIDTKFLSDFNTIDSSVKSFLLILIFVNIIFCFGFLLSMLYIHYNLVESLDRTNDEKKLPIVIQKEK
jgi:hypothetical protein